MNVEHRHHHLCNLCKHIVFSAQSVGVYTVLQDIISLVVQGLGGGVASGSQTSQSQANLVRVHCYSGKFPMN